MGKPVGNVYLPDGTVLEDVMIVKVIHPQKGSNLENCVSFQLKQRVHESNI
jgi:hypothetical protein